MNIRECKIKTLVFLLTLILIPGERIIALQKSDEISEAAQLFKNKEIPNLFSESLSADSSEHNETISIRYIDGSGFVAFNRNGIRLFTVFPYDNGPDYPSQGLFRIIRDGKIGFADTAGNVIIEPQFSAALPFQDGLAGFCESCITVNYGEHRAWEQGKWGFINRRGKIVIPARYDRIYDSFTNGYAIVGQDREKFTIDKKGIKIMSEEKDYRSWINRLGQSVSLLHAVTGMEEAAVVPEWTKDDSKKQFLHLSTEVLELDVLFNGKSVLLYTIVPWQDFTLPPMGGDVDSRTDFYDLLTVTDFAVIFRYFFPRLMPAEEQYARKFDRHFKQMINLEKNQQKIDDIRLKLPAGLQIISSQMYPNYVDLQVSLPGSRLPEPNQWQSVVANKMLRVHLIPDRGDIRTRWFKPVKPFADTYYTAVEDTLLTIYNNALIQAKENPDNREIIFNKASDQMRGIFSAANIYVNQLYDFYKSRLFNWLLIPEREEKNYDPETMFPDYQPKRTPDTVLDYLPGLAAEINRLPDPSPQNLADLIYVLEAYQAQARKNPGQWEEGNIILGAKPKEYRPSVPELLVAETGARIRSVLNNAPAAEIEQISDKEKIKTRQLKFKYFTFTHADVMGSGRFFYVEEIKEVVLNIGK